MSQWPSPQPPYDPYQDQQQQQQQPAYLGLQYTPPPQTPKPSGGSLIKTLNFFSSKPSYVPSSPQPQPSTSPTYVTSPQSYVQPQNQWNQPPSPFQPQYQSPTSSYDAYQPPPPPGPLADIPPNPQPPPTPIPHFVPSQPPPPPAPAPYVPPAPTPASPHTDNSPEIERLRRLMSELEVNLTQKTNECHSVRTEISKFMRTIDEKDAEVARLNRELAAASTNPALQDEVDNLRKQMVEKDQELARARDETAQLRGQIDAIQKQSQQQIQLAQQDAQQLRANAELNHKLAVETGEELAKVRREQADLQAAARLQTEEIEQARQSAGALRQQLQQQGTSEESYQKMWQELHDLKQTLANKDVEIAGLRAKQPTQPMTPVQTPPVWNQTTGVPSQNDYYNSGQTKTPEQPLYTPYVPPQQPPAPPQPSCTSYPYVPQQPPAPEQPSYTPYVPPIPEQPSYNPNVPPVQPIPSQHQPQGEAVFTVPDYGKPDEHRPPSDLEALPEPSPSEKEWERQKQQEGAKNIFLDVLMTELTGLELVKAHFLRVKGKIDTAQRQGVPLSGERFDVAILGNPGTGKTTVAKLYRAALSTIGVAADNMVYFTGTELLGASGATTATTQIDELAEAGGGFFFLDDVHMLTDSQNAQAQAFGTHILNNILGLIEKYVGTIIFIFAGHKSAIEEHATLANKVASKLVLDDFTDAELLLMMRRSIVTRYSGMMEVEGGIGGIYMRIAIRRLGKSRGSTSFENARDLDKLFTRIIERQEDRMTRMRQEGLNPNDFWFSAEDIIGPNPSEAIQKSTAWKQLQELIGLDAVKQSVRSMIDMIETNYRRELQEKPPMAISLNRVFLGSPGTGKTSVAKLYGKILADLGLLSNGEVLVKNPADFVGAYLGETEQKTKAILAAAAGKVLIIDEAYMLYPGGSGGNIGGGDSDLYKMAVVDTLVAEVQSTPGEDRCVLLLGYEEEMRNMFQNVNPGLARRFAIEDAFRFEDFTEAELRNILGLKLRQQGLHATDAAKDVASEVLNRARMRPNFGNAGEVENMLSQAKVRYQSRISKVLPHLRPLTGDVVFEPVDIDPEFARGATAALNCRTLFSDTVGCEAIITKLEGYLRIAANAKTAGIPLHELIPTNFLFKGPPGTGKTMTARKMGQVYYNMGFLSSPRVIECSTTDMIGQYLGQTGPKTQKLVESARGSVLFIDEAYRLAESEYAAEALNELVDILTKPAFLGKIVVILAGYDDDINRLLSKNSGLSSRFPEEIAFTNMSPAECIEVLARDVEAKKISAPWLRDQYSPPYKDLVEQIAKVSALPGWGNARDMKTLAKNLVGTVYKDCPDLVLRAETAVEAVGRMVGERQARAVSVRADGNVQSMGGEGKRQEMLGKFPGCNTWKSPGM